MDLSIPGYSGHCWGYPFDWQNNRGLWTRNTPFITSTPYCFEAFLGVADARDQRNISRWRHPSRGSWHAIFETSTISAEASAGSYSPNDQTQVINASAYRAFVLFEAWRRFHIDEYRDIAERNLRFILDSQREDGSWLYALESPAEGVHRSFPHLFRAQESSENLNRVVGSAAVVRAIEKGWAFYRRALFHNDETPKSFAVEPRTQLARVEMYNFAEAITLGTLLKASIPEAFALARRLTQKVIREYQLADGHFVTRTFRGGLRHTTPFLRWPQAQMFLALTNMLRALPELEGAVSP